MSKKAIRSIIIFMSISLLGLISFQAYWISNQVSIETNSFDQKMNQLLAEVDNNIERNDARIFVKKYEDETEQFPTKIEQKDISIIIDASGKNISVLSNNTSSINIEEQPQTTTVITKTLNGKTVTTTTSSSFAKTSAIQKYQNKKEILDEVLDDIALKYAFNEYPIDEQIKNAPIDSFIQSGLSEMGLNSLGYYFSVVNNDTLLKEGGNLESNSDFTQYNKRLDLGEDHKVLLQLQVPNKASLVLNKLWTSLLLSILLTILLLATFIYTLNSILKQKRISVIKADFINNMTHEFKTPIATISLAIDSILHPSNQNRVEEQKKLGGIIKKENERMNQQVESLLNVALFEKEAVKLNIEELNIHDLLIELKENFQLSYTTNLGDIALNFSAKNSTIRADKMHLYNALRNIIDNGIKYSEEDFRIRIETQNNSENILIKFSDKGIGMDKETQKRAFDRFYRKTSGNLHTTKGFGLGLSYVKEVIVRMGGTITIKSELSEGSSFIVEIPNI